MSFYNTGEKIKEIRKLRNLNQDQLAELSSLNRVTIAKYESGRIEPGAQALARIADALDVSTDVLLGRDEPPDKIVNKPKTPEARIISGVVDILPPSDREKALNLMKAAYSEYFDKADEKNA